MARADKAELAPVKPGEAGYALGLAGFIVSFFFGLVGLILSIVARSQSRRIGKRNTFAKVGIIIGSIQLVLGVLFTVGSIAGLVWLGNYCRENPNASSCDSEYSTDSQSDRGMHYRGYDGGYNTDPEDTRTY